MAGISFLSDNLSSVADITITTGTENAQFPLTNIQLDSTAKKFRSTGNTVVLEFDLLSVRDIDTVAIVGDATAQWGLTAASFKTSVTTDFSGATPINIPISGENNIGYVSFTSVSHRYLELTLTGNGSYAELSNIFIGEITNLPNNSLSLGSFEYGNTDQSRVSVNRYGQRFIDQLPLTKQINGALEFCTKDEQETIDDLFIYHGKFKPIWVIVDSNSDGMNNGQYKLAMYAYFNEIPLWTAAGGLHYNAALSFREVI